jgi:hypothetical protein
VVSDLLARARHAEAEVVALRRELAELRRRYEQLEHELLLELGRDEGDEN